jgi:hypothetical protein
MAKRDNPESYNLIFPPKVSVVEEPIRMQNTFSRDDNFYWADFVALMKAKVFESKAELRREFKKNMPRVLALVSEGEGLVVKKDSEACLFSHLSLAKLEGLSNFTMKYWSDSVPDDAPEAACREVEVKDPLIKTKKQYQKDVKLVPFLKSDISEYVGFNRIDIFPGGNPPDKCFNEWVGFQAKHVGSADMTLLQPLFDVLYYGWAGSNQAIFRRIITFLAMTVVEPQKKIGGALVLYGIGGDGKSAVCKFLINYVLGKQLCTNEINLRALFGKDYTKKLMGKKLHFCHPIRTR